MTHKNTHTHHSNAHNSEKLGTPKPKWECLPVFSPRTSISMELCEMKLWCHKTNAFGPSRVEIFFLQRSFVSGFYFKHTQKIKNHLFAWLSSHSIMLRSLMPRKIAQKWTLHYYSNDCLRNWKNVFQKRNNLKKETFLNESQNIHQFWWLEAKINNWAPSWISLIGS